MTSLLVLPSYFLLLIWIDELEVELLTVEVGMSDLHFDAVSEVVAMVITPAFQAIILLVEVVEITLQLAKRNHAFALVLVYLDIQTELCDT